MLSIRNLKTALLDIGELSVPAAACVALIGPSGAGKSLLLRAIADLDPNEGTVSLGAETRDAIPAPEWRRRVGLVPAESGWWADRVGDHFPPGAAVAEYLAALGLPPGALDWDVARLSTGERQRLALARALCLEPEALLLDEPTAALDGAATAQAEALLQARLAAGAAILLVTHDPAQAGRLAAKTCTMRAGRLVPAESAAR